MSTQLGADGQKSFANFVSASVDPSTPILYRLKLKPVLLSLIQLLKHDSRYDMNTHMTHNTTSRHNDKLRKYNFSPIIIIIIIIIINLVIYHLYAGYLQLYT